jgi:hypothetical protein
MSASRLYPCPSCNRHVRAHEQACPHCGRALSESDVPPLVAKTAVRLGRAAMLALTAGASIVACDDTRRTPFYGAPDTPLRDSGSTTPFPETPSSDAAAVNDASPQDEGLADAGDDDPRPDD